MLTDKVKLEITADYLPLYSKSVWACPDYKALEKITRTFIQNLLQVAFPVEKLALLPYRDPQASQISDEDFRESQEIIGQTTKELKRFVDKQKVELAKKESLLSVMADEKDVLQKMEERLKLKGTNI